MDSVQPSQSARIRIAVLSITVVVVAFSLSALALLGREAKGQDMTAA